MNAVREGVRLAADAVTHGKPFRPLRTRSLWRSSFVLVYRLAHSHGIQRATPKPPDAIRQYECDEPGQVRQQLIAHYQHYAYEAAKQQFKDQHPGASAEEYQEAMRLVADRLGI